MEMFEGFEAFVENGRPRMRVVKPKAKETLRKENKIEW